MRRMATLLACGSLLSLSPFTPAAAPPAPVAPLALRARAVLQAHCASCHGGLDKARGGFGYVLDRDRLVESAQLVPGQPRQSPLYQRIAAGEMPPSGKRPRPSPDDLAALRRWIEAGAPTL